MVVEVPRQSLDVVSRWRDKVNGSCIRYWLSIGVYWTNGGKERKDEDKWKSRTYRCKVTPADLNALTFIKGDMISCPYLSNTKI